MTSTDIDDAAINGMTDGEQPTRLSLPPLDSFRAVKDLVALAVDPRAVKRHLRQLYDALTAITAAQHKLEADRAAHAEQVVKDRAEIADEKAAATKRILTAEESERGLAERTERYTKLAQAWGDLKLPGEPYALFGTISRSVPFSPLEKAKFARDHDGQLPMHPDAPLPLATDGEPIEPSRATIRHDPQGAEFPEHISLTRSPEKPEPVSIRVRSATRRGGANVA